MLVQHPKIVSYNYRSEPVHLVHVGQIRVSFRCYRCHRDLPEFQFSPIGTKYIRRRAYTVLHPYCFTCRKQLRGEWIDHGLYSPQLDRFFTKLYSSMKQGANSRSIVWAVSKDDILGFYIKQGGLCALSGLELDWKTKGVVGRGNRAKLAPSVDRINSHGNYVIDNIQIVAAAVNSMKGDLSQEAFIAFCDKIASHRISL